MTKRWKWLKTEWRVRSSSYFDQCRRRRPNLDAIVETNDYFFFSRISVIGYFLFEPLNSLRTFAIQDKSLFCPCLSRRSSLCEWRENGEESYALSSLSQQAEAEAHRECELKKAATQRHIKAAHTTSYGATGYVAFTFFCHSTLFSRVSVLTLEKFLKMKRDEKYDGGACTETMGKRRKPSFTRASMDVQIKEEWRTRVRLHYSFAHHTHTLIHTCSWRA